MVLAIQTIPQQITTNIQTTLQPQQQQLQPQQLLQIIIIQIIQTIFQRIVILQLQQMLQTL